MASPVRTPDGFKKNGLSGAQNIVPGDPSPQTLNSGLAVYSVDNNGGAAAKTVVLPPARSLIGQGLAFLNVGAGAGVESVVLETSPGDTLQDGVSTQLTLTADASFLLTAIDGTTILPAALP
jgi:hypothetical protein